VSLPRRGVIACASTWSDHRPRRSRPSAFQRYAFAVPLTYHGALACVAAVLSAAGWFWRDDVLSRLLWRLWPLYAPYWCVEANAVTPCTCQRSRLWPWPGVTVCLLRNLAPRCGDAVLSIILGLRPRPGLPPVANTRNLWYAI